jgi:predicted dehydrogenase
MLAAVDRGWNVVCEKPFLLDVDLVARVRARAEARGIAIVPVHNWKYAPIVIEATRRLRSGSIGRLRRVAIDVERLRDFQGADPARPNWRRDPAIAGGGILMDHGWHAVYLARHWFEANPSEVEAELGRPRPDSVEEDADVRLVFPGGRDASIRLTWNGSVRRNVMTLAGDRGTMTIADDRLVIDADGGEVVTFPEALSAGSHHADWFEAFLPDLVAAFRSPASSRAAYDEAAACLDVIQRAYQVGV